MAQGIQVKPELLNWALERSGKVEADLVTAFPKVSKWLTGEAFPTMKQLENFSKKTFTPLGYLFLDTPPEDKLPIQDFRTLQGQEHSRPSPDLLDTVHSMQDRQEWMREFLIEEGSEPFGYIGSKGIKDTHIDIALDMRETLHLSKGWAEQVSTWSESLKVLRDAIEEAGVIIVINGVVGNNTRRTLKVKEFRGFALVDEYAPLIFINGTDSKSAQMFTLIHELCHLWIGESGVSNTDKLLSNNIESEKLCNAVAAEFLVPESSFKESISGKKPSEELFKQLSNIFKVSPLVIARRSLDLGFISKRYFFKLYEGYTAKPVDKEGDNKSRGNFWNTQNVRIGEVFGEAIAQATLEGRLLHRDAYRLTGLKAEAFKTYIGKLGF